MTLQSGLLEGQIFLLNLQFLFEGRVDLFSSPDSNPVDYFIPFVSTNNSKDSLNAKIKEAFAIIKKGGCHFCMLGIPSRVGL